MPSRIARASMSSLQEPAPVSRSGVRFGAERNGTPSSAKLFPPPSVPGLTGNPGDCQSTSEWQNRHPLTELARYRPTLHALGVRSNRPFGERTRSRADDGTDADDRGDGGDDEQEQGKQTVTGNLQPTTHRYPS